MIHMKLTGYRIEQQCRKQNLTVKQIQEQLHIGSFQAVYNWFAGKTLPSVDNLLELSKLLHVPMERLLIEGEDDMEKISECEILSVFSHKKHSFMRTINYNKQLWAVIQF